MLKSKDIAIAIAAISVTGVKFKDLSSFSDAAYGRDIPVFMPNLENWIGSSNSTMQTFGTASTRFWIIERTFSYVYLYEKVGAVRTLSDISSAMADSMDLIWEALLELDIPEVDITNVTWSKSVTVEDPSGNQFYGFTCDVTVKERVNA
jgi:hypothetical protein